MSIVNIQYYKTEIGELIMGSYNNELCLLDFRYRRMRTTIDNRIQKGLGVTQYIEKDNNVLTEVRKQLDEYLKENRIDFDIPLLMVGSDFQKSVWNELMKVSYGSTSTYLQLAKNVNNKKAVRAVASANGANAISILIPCHRIIGSNGELVGYAGGLPIKKKLLMLEKNYSLF